MNQPPASVAGNPRITAPVNATVLLCAAELVSGKHVQRWVNGRFVEENLAPAHDWTYPNVSSA